MERITEEYKEEETVPVRTPDSQKFSVAEWASMCYEYNLVLKSGCVVFV